MQTEQDRARLDELARAAFLAGLDYLDEEFGGTLCSRTAWEWEDAVNLGGAEGYRREAAAVEAVVLARVRAGLAEVRADTPAGASAALAFDLIAARLEGPG